MKTASTKGVVHVGTLTVPTLKCGFVRYVLIASIPRSRNTHKLQLISAQHGDAQELVNIPCAKDCSISSQHASL